MPQFSCFMNGKQKPMPDLAEESFLISKEALSNSSKAMLDSRLATNIAISAIVLSIIMAMQTLIEWFFHKS